MVSLSALFMLNSHLTAMQSLSPFGDGGVFLAIGDIGGTLAIIGGALALGLRHGIDWDHIAAITDVTSGSASNYDDRRLTGEPALMLTDESHHRLALATSPVAVATAGNRRDADADRGSGARPSVARFFREQRTPLMLGTLYAIGHGTVVIILGLLALLASEFLPEWVDPIMGRIVGATLLFLAVYLYYSIYRYFRGGEFRLRSRWMLVFSAVRNGYRWLMARLHGHEYHHVAHTQQYGARTAYSIGLIHGIGAETGTQALVIATAVGASSRGMGVVALFAFVVGLLISNSVVTIASATGFVSTQRRQWLYVGAGLFAASFSLVLGVLFLLAEDGRLPSLDPYFRWIGGPA